MVSQRFLSAYCVYALAVFALAGCLGAETHDAADATSDVAQKSGCSADKPCQANQVCVAAVCVPKPADKEVGALSDPTNDNVASTDKPQLDCIDKPITELVKGLSGPASVTLWGRVDRFGGGDVTKDVEVAVFKLADFHPEVCAGMADSDAQAACFVDDKKVGAPIAKAISLDATTATDLQVVSAKKSGESCVKHLECPEGYECRDLKNGNPKQCVLTHGIYAIENIPTNTQLVVRVRKNKANADWHTSYLWDIVLFSNRTDAKGAASQPAKYINTDTYRVNPTIVGEGQWGLVTATIGLSPISDGNGVIGGRVRDCGVAGGRGGWTLHNVKIGLSVAATGLAFFNDDEDNTVPDKNRSATDVLGRYAAVDVPAGPNRVAVAGTFDGKLTPLGGLDVYVIPNSLTIVSLPGRVPVLTK